MQFGDAIGVLDNIDTADNHRDSEAECHHGYSGFRHVGCRILVIVDREVVRHVDGVDEIADPIGVIQRR